MSDEVRLIGLRDRAALDPVRLVSVRPPSSASGLTRSVSGLLHADGFDTDTIADYSFWYETAGSASVTGGRLRLQPNDDSEVIMQVDGISCGKCFMQTTFRFSDVTASYPALILRASGWGVGGGDLIDKAYRYFFNTWDDTITLNKVVATVGTPLDGPDAESGWATATDYDTQMFVEDDLQEAWLSLNNHKHNAADATHNGLNSQGVGLFTREFSSGYTEFDDLIYMKDKIITCTGLSAGQKLKVFTSGDAQVFMGTESGGTATIDVSKFTTTGSPLVPLAGWAYVTVTDSGDVELARYTGAVYPGDQYGYTP